MLGKRIPTLIAILLLIGIGAGVWWWQKSTALPVNSEINPQEVKITNTSDTKFSVSWKTATMTTGAVEYGVVGGKLDLVADDDRGPTHKGYTHHITLSDLQPNTQYAFRILSGENRRRYDNNGSVYTATTGSSIAAVPAARSLYGDIVGSKYDEIIYVSMPGAFPASVTTKNSGSYSLAISTIRSTDLASYATYDPSATIISLLIVDGEKNTQVTATTSQITPLPTITLGTNADFRGVTEQELQVAQVEPTTSEPTPTPMPTETPQAVEVFNIEPLANVDINAVTTKDYTITNPAIEGEVLSTTKPEFRGTGVANAPISIAISGQKAVSDSLRVASDGSWKWTPAIALSIGKQKITLSYTDESSKTKTIERAFSISTASVTSEPAFVASSSGETDNEDGSTNSGSLTSPSPRAAMPATESGVPVTGVMTPTLLTAGLGFAIMVIGAFLMAF